MQAHEKQSPASAVFARMRAYVTDLERTSPPVFVGRKEILDELRFVVERVAVDAPAFLAAQLVGAAAATWLFAWLTPREG